MNAQTALELVQAAPPEAIVIDLTMPFINGLGFLHRLRETQAIARQVTGRRRLQ
jgi:CheY-like chemotaxis protein